MHVAEYVVAPRPQAPYAPTARTGRCFQRRWNSLTLTRSEALADGEALAVRHWRPSDGKQRECAELGYDPEKVLAVVTEAASQGSMKLLN